MRNPINWITPLYGCCGSYRWLTIGSLSGDVFERRTSTGSEPFSLLICLDATKFVFLSVFTLKETICPRICSKSRPISAKTPLPVDVRRSKTSLLKLCCGVGIVQSLFTLLYHVMWWLHPSATPETTHFIAIWFRMDVFTKRNTSDCYHLFPR